jgi:hypothetical protein
MTYLLRQVANPNVHGLDKELTFRVQQTAFGEYGETLRTISLNGNVEVARGAFQAAVRCYATALGRHKPAAGQLRNSRLAGSGGNRTSPSGVYRVPSPSYSLEGVWMVGERGVMH